MFEKACFLWYSPPLKPCCVIFSYRSSSIPAVSAGCFWMFFIWWFERVPASCQDTGTVSSPCASSSSNASQRARWPSPGVFSSASDIWVDGVCFPCLFSPFQSGAGNPAAVLWGVVPWYGHRELPNHVFSHSVLTFLLACLMVQGLM